MTAEQIRVMPNPGTGEFLMTLNFPGEQDVSVRVVNMVGQEIMSTRLGTVTTKIVNINLNGEPPGVYFAEISNGRQKLAKKLVISR